MQGLDCPLDGVNKEKILLDDFVASFVPSSYALRLLEAADPLKKLIGHAGQVVYSPKWAGRNRPILWT